MESTGHRESDSRSTESKADQLQVDVDTHAEPEHAGKSQRLKGSFIRLIRRLGYVAVSACIGLLFGVGSIFGAHGLVRAFAADTHFGAMMVLWWMLFLVPAIMIHECGHYAAARMVGMRVFRMQVLRCEITPMRRGWRWRWQRLPRRIGYAGYVMALSHPERRSLVAQLSMTAGGPGANLLFAGGLLLATSVWPDGGLAGFLDAFASMNLVMGVANLIPCKGRVGSDGYRIIQMLVKRSSIQLGSYGRLIALSMFGCTADQLPEDDLVSLEKGRAPMPLIALWFRCKASQLRGDWERAAVMCGTLDDLLKGQDERVTKALSSLIQLLSLEIEFARAMSTRDPAGLRAFELSKSAAWDSPHVWPRCEALQARLMGDQAASKRYLDQSRRLAENDIDDSVVKGERLLREQVACI